MELVLPNNYVALEQEEMMYLDGGDATAVYYFPGMVAKLSALTGNPIVVGLAALGAWAGANYLWNNRVFY